MFLAGRIGQASAILARQMAGDLVACRGVNGAEIEVGEIGEVFDVYVGAWCEGLVDAGEQRFDSRLERG